MTELNTLIGLPKNFDCTTLVEGKSYAIIKDRERSFPLHIAMLLVDSEWNFYGYGVVNSLFSKVGKTTLEFTVVSLFAESERALYKDKFISAAKITGEIQ
ncbi:MAG: hypothetical protein WCO78_04705 [Candidatus Roizmanbacteria bacterium]